MNFIYNRSARKIRTFDFEVTTMSGFTQQRLSVTFIMVKKFHRLMHSRVVYFYWSNAVWRTYL